MPFHTDGSVVSAYPKTISTIVKKKSPTAVSFFSDLSTMFPNDRDHVTGLFIDQTLGATRSPDTFALYRQWRKSAPADGDATIARQKYDHALMPTKIFLGSNSEINMIFNKPLRINTQNLVRPLSIDLNQDTREVLIDVMTKMVGYYKGIGLSESVDGFQDHVEAEVDAIIARREELVNISALDQLSGVVSFDLLALLRARAL